MHLKELDANLVVVLDALLIDASVTKAAERLGRSPSAISHALANLREVFGDELFVRAGQRLAPTAKALEIAPTVHVIVTGIESLLRPAAPFEPATQERSFTILCREAAEFTLLQPLRQRLKEKAPGVAIASGDFDPDGWMEKMRLGQAQFAIVEALSGDDNGELHWKELFEEPWITLAPQDHAFAQRKVSPEDFASAGHVVISAPPKLQDHLKARLDDYRINNGAVTWASSLFAGVFLALKSQSLVTLPASVAHAVNGHLPFGKVEHGQPHWRMKTFLVWHRSNDRDECHAWLRDEIAACVPALD